MWKRSRPPKCSSKWLTLFRRRVAETSSSSEAWQRVIITSGLMRTIRSARKTSTVYWLRAPVPAFIHTETGPWRYLAPDGVSIAGNNAAANVRRSWFMCAAQTYQLANSGDDVRKPFFNLAVPIDAGM